MRAAVFARHGGADVIRVVEDWPEPELDAGGVIVAVEVADEQAGSGRGRGLYRAGDLACVDPGDAAWREDTDVWRDDGLPSGYRLALCMDPRAQHYRLGRMDARRFGKTAEAGRRWKAHAAD